MMGRDSIVTQFKQDLRFKNIQPLKKRVLLSSPTPHREAEWKYIRECYETGWLTTAGTNINELEEVVSSYMGGGKKAAALVNGTAAIHLAVKMAAERIYHSSSGISTPNGRGAGGSLFGKRVFVSDLTFAASVNPIVYEGGEPVLIDSEYETWNMDPEALRTAFELYPDVKIVVFVHLYGVVGKIEEVKRICEEHGAVLIEDAAESLGAGTIFAGAEVKTGSVGDYGIISFNGNKIITGSAGGMLIVPDEYSYSRAKKWSTQSREAAPWYEHEELGYNYRISNLVAGVILGQWGFLSEHMSAKREIYERYVEGMKDLPVTIHGGGNYWLSCALINKDGMAETARSGRKAVYEVEKSKSTPTEILEVLDCFNAEGRPIWKPMHLQPMFRGNSFVSHSGLMQGRSDTYIEHGEIAAVTEDIFERGICLPSDNKMNAEQQRVVMNVICGCFAGSRL